MSLEEAIKYACGLPTLTQALVFIVIWNDLQHPRNSLHACIAPVVSHFNKLAEAKVGQ